MGWCQRHSGAIKDIFLKNINNIKFLARELWCQRSPVIFNFERYLQNNLTSDTLCSCGWIEFRGRGNAVEMVLIHDCAVTALPRPPCCESSVLSCSGPQTHDWHRTPSCSWLAEGSPPSLLQCLFHGLCSYNSSDPSKFPFCTHRTWSSS